MTKKRFKFTFIESQNSPTRNRGPVANDAFLFGEKFTQRLRSAFADLNELLTKGYPIKGAIIFVGNHYRLNKRQQTALSRAIASDQLIAQIKDNALDPLQLTDQSILIDGFNVLILLESALSGAFIFKGADELLRDLSGVHGTYKHVKQTVNAITHVGHTLKSLKVGPILWVLDEPVSNSLRLKDRILEIGKLNSFNWDVIRVLDADKYIVANEGIAISSDSWIVARKKWYNLAQQIIKEKLPETALIILKDDEK